MIYGVNPQGFSRKPLSQILQDIQAKNVATYGNGIIQTAQTPLGQLNGMAADLAAELWEVGEAIYQSIDPDQAEGIRLDSLGKLRIIERLPGEGDIDFRQAITNAQRGRIDIEDLQRAIEAVPGVTWAKVWVNDTDTTDENGIPANHIALSVLGGDDVAVAEAARAYIVPGVGQFGNTNVSIVLDGFCRQMWLHRPAEVDTTIAVTVITRSGDDNCPPPSLNTIGQGLFAALTTTRMANGTRVTLHDLRALSAQLYGRTVEVVSAVVTPPTVTFDQIVNVTTVTASVST